MLEFVVTVLMRLLEAKLGEQSWCLSPGANRSAANSEFLTADIHTQNKTSFSHNTK